MIQDAAILVERFFVVVKEKKFRLNQRFVVVYANEEECA